MSEAPDARAPYHLLVDVPPPKRVDTAALFAQSDRAGLGPLDSFIANTNVLNTVYLPYGTEAQPWLAEVGALVLQGYMSAVESYVRAIITGVIFIDDVARRLVNERQVSFGLVLGRNDVRHLPEVLLENHSFSTEGRIQDALKTFLGISEISPELTLLDREFRKLCELRHCCVHRFGKLGSYNAKKLGLEAHRAAIEHPFSPSRANTEAIADILQAFVKELNNFVFKSVLDRSLALGDAPPLWSWDFAVDRARFEPYYELFALREFEPRSPPVEEVYALFKAIGEKSHADKAAKRSRSAEGNQQGGAATPLG